MNKKRFVLIIALVITVLLVGEYIFSRIRPVDAAQYPTQKNKSIVERLSGDLLKDAYIGWKELSNEDYSLRYPPSWSLGDGSVTLYETDKAFKTGSRPPIYYPYYITISNLEKTNQTSKEYVDLQYKYQEEASNREQEFNRNSKYPEYNTNYYRPFERRKSLVIDNNSFDSYSFGDFTYFAISNGKVLLTGRGTLFDRIDDDSVESKIIRSIRLKD